jgi:acyl dehydratase
VTPIDALHDLVGTQIGLSDWLVIDQRRLDQYELAVGPQPVDAVPPFLLLSLLPYLLSNVSLPAGNPRAMINYGLDRVKVGATVAVGERVRARAFLEGVEVIGESVQLRRKVDVEKETGEQSLEAITLTRLVF